MINTNNNDMLYTEDQIITIGDHLKSLKGMILLDTHGDFFILKDYLIEGIDASVWNGLFKPKKQVRMFLIKNIVISGDDGEDIIHEEDQMCTLYGINNLMEYHANYTALQAKLIKFTLKNDINLNFGKLVVSKTNKSSNFKRR